MGRIVRGTCDGTGAAITVCLGFIPDKVELVNVDDAGALFGVVHWWRGMDLELAAAPEGGILWNETNAATTGDQTALTAAAGISPYTGGDEIVFDKNTSNRWEDSAGNDVSEKYVDGAFVREAASDAKYRCIGQTLTGTSTPPHGTKVRTPAGFTIGDNAAMNQDGEQLIWIAYKAD